MGTKRVLVERIRRQLAGGFPSSTDRVQDNEIALAVGSVASKILRTEVFNTTYNFAGDSIPDGAVIAAYTEIPVTKYAGGYAMARLPIQPMYLPEGMGVISVYPTGKPEKEFIPVSTMSYNILSSERLLNTLAAKTYSFEQGQVIVHTDLVEAGINQLDMKLAVMDIASIGWDDFLPITPDQEQQIIIEVLQQYGLEAQTVRDTDVQPQLNPQQR